MSDFRRHGAWLAVLLWAGALAAGEAHAQATFSVSSSSSVVVRTGHTEPLGAVTFRVDSGTSVEDVIEIALGSDVFLTSGDTVDISTRGRVSEANFSTSVEADAGVVRLIVPDGMQSNDSVTIKGLRVSIPASGIETLDARISMSANQLDSRSRDVRLISRVADGIFIDPTTDSAYTYNANSRIVDNLGNFVFGEGFAGAFNEDVEIIFRASPLPRNTQLRFPFEIPSQSGGALLLKDPSNDEEINGVVLVSGERRNEVVYTIESTGSSGAIVETFSFRPMLERTGNPGAGTGFYQVTLGPVGAAEPSPAAPSRAVPRYEELLLPELAELSRSRTFLFPVDRGADTQTFTVANTAVGSAPLTLRAYDAAGELLSGPDIANEVSRVLGANRTLTFGLDEMFGDDATTETVASVAIESRNDRAVTTAIGVSAGGRFAAVSRAGIEPAYFPFDRRNASEAPIVSVVGESIEAFEARWTLMDATGAEIASATSEVEPGGAVRGGLDELFGMAAGALPLAGYVRLESETAQFHGSLVDNPGEASHAVPGLVASGVSRIVYPYFTVAPVYDTVVTLVNASNQIAIIRATAYDYEGAAMAEAFQTQISPLGMAELSWKEILGMGVDWRSGYFAIEVQSQISNPFASIPRVAGMVRIETPGVSAAAAQLSADRGNELFITPVASTDDEFTGLAIRNRGTAEAMEVMVEYYAADGELLEVAELEVSPRALHVALLRDLFPEVDSETGGYLRLTSPSTRMAAISYRGPFDRSWLLYLKAQTAP